MSDSFDPLDKLDPEAKRKLRDLGERMLPTPEFNALVGEEAVRLGRFVETLGDELAPMLVAVLEKRDKDGERARGLVALETFTDSDAKRRVLFAAGAKAAKTGESVVAGMLCTESWVKMMSPAESWRARQHGVPVPSESPDRREAITIMARTLDGRVAMALAFLDRGGGKAKVGQWTLTEWQGRASGDKAQDNLLGFFFAGLSSRIIPSALRRNDLHAS
jgi:hypothetical protein